MITESMKADLVEALIGAFYLGHGMSSSAKFMACVGILKTSACFEYLMNGVTTVISPCHFREIRLPASLSIRELLPESPSESSLINALNEDLLYHFEDVALLEQALTHYSHSNTVNYERLEYLGDAVLDILVLSNFSLLGDDFSAQEFTLLKHRLVQNSVLAKVSVSLGLHKYLRTDSQHSAEVLASVDALDWTEDIVQFGGNKDVPCKILGDIFESVVGAILLDSKNLHVTMSCVGTYFRSMIVYLMKNRDQLNGNIRTLIAHYNQTHTEPISIHTTEEDKAFNCTVSLEGKTVSSHSSNSKQLSERLAVISAYKELKAQRVLV